MEAYSVCELGIDVRRFTSFGVIKVSLFTFPNLSVKFNLAIYRQGFLRRVHRWPILLPEDPTAAETPEAPTSLTRARVQSVSNSTVSYVSTEKSSSLSEAYQSRPFRGRPSDPSPTIPSVSQRSL